MHDKSGPPHDDERDDEPERLDKWLWTARFFKTRALAAAAVDGGKVHLNGERVKRSKTVRVGHLVSIRLGPYEHVVVVRGISDRRGPASVAATLYQETEESRAARERLLSQRQLESSAAVHDAGRPSKKDRRQIDQLRRGARK